MSRPVVMLVVLVIATSLGCKPPECNTATDCNDSTKPVCSDRGQCVACAADEQCAEGFICEATTCTAGCRSDADRCKSPLTCTPGKPCSCELATDPQCGVAYCRGQTCPVPHQGCYTNADCGRGGRCVPTTHSWANICVGGTCANDDSCPAGEYCNLDAATCAPGCRTNADCDGGTCTANACP